MPSRIVTGTTVVVAIAAMAACGGSPAPSRPPATRPVGTGPPATPTTASRGPASIVFVASTSAGQVVRVLSATAGSPRTAAALPITANVLGAGFGRLGYEDSADASIHVVDLASGDNRRYESGAPSGTPASASILGGAFSPDGARFAYTLSTLSGGSLRILSLAGGTSTALHAWPAGMPVDEPDVWTDVALLGTTVVPFSDAGPQAAVVVNPATGAETSRSALGDSTGPVFAASAAYAATAFHTGGLGDDADAAGAPGPAQPFNSVRIFAVGGTPTVIYSKAHHANTVLAVSPDGGSTLFYADSAAGGFAGISMSPDFGLFLYRGGAPVQLAFYDGSRYDGGAFIGSDQAVVARHSGSGEQLILTGGGHPSPVTVDTIPGGDQPAFVAFSSSS